MSIKQNELICCLKSVDMSNYRKKEKGKSVLIFYGLKSFRFTPLFGYVS